MDLDEKYLLVLSQAAKTRQLLSGGAVNYGLVVWAKMQNMSQLMGNSNSNSVTNRDVAVVY